MYFHAMRHFRSNLKSGSLATIFLMVLQVFAFAAAAARQIESTALHAQGKQIVICSVHGQMVVDWDGPAPPPSKQKPKGSCPFCLTGCNAFGANAPDALLIRFDDVRYVTKLIGPAHNILDDIAPSPEREKSSPPRGPPVIAS